MRPTSALRDVDQFLPNGGVCDPVSLVGRPPQRDLLGEGAHQHGNIVGDILPHNREVIRAEYLLYELSRIRRVRESSAFRGPVADAHEPRHRLCLCDQLSLRVNGEDHGTFARIVSSVGACTR